MKLPPGKIPVDILNEVVFKNLGVTRKEVTVGPSVGVDSAVLDLGDKSIIVAMDPITGAVERIGWLAVNVNANDVATFGVEPSFLFSCLMLPQNADQTLVETISTQMGNAAAQLNIAIVGGHCETTPKLTNPIVVVAAMGYTKKGHYVTSAGAEPNDKLILTKSAGIEGTAILASDREAELKKTLNNTELQKAKAFYEKISIVPEALSAFRAGGVHAMHDPTEGGIAGGIHEMGDATGLGVEVWRDKIAVETVTTKICDHFKIDPLQLIGSGALLIAAKAERAAQILCSLQRQQIPASIIGNFINDSTRRTVINRNGRTTELPRPISDHLWLALEGDEGGVYA